MFISMVPLVPFMLAVSQITLYSALTRVCAMYCTQSIPSYVVAWQARHQVLVSAVKQLTL